jgi:hypothetical protein
MRIFLAGGPAAAAAAFGNGVLVDRMVIRKND